MKKLGLWILCCLLLLSIASANHFKDYKLEFTPTEYGITEHIALTFVPDQDTNSIAYDVESLPVNPKASSGSNSSFDTDGSTIIIFDDFKKGQGKNIDIEFTSYSLVENVGKTNIFSFKFFPPEKMDLEVTFNLPKGFTVSEIDPAISPSPTDIISDGRSIMIKWEFQNLEESVNFILLYEDGSSSLIWIILILILIIAGIVVFFTHKHKGTKKVIDKTLYSDEQKIVDLLREDESRTQKDLVKLTGFSKAKMSKLIRKLEEKGVLEKKPHMTTNKLILNKEFK